MRAGGAPTDDPVLRAALVAYMSDLMVLDTAAVAHGRTLFDPAMQAARIGHAIWFRRPVRADGWLLDAGGGPSASGARVFARGSVSDRSDVLVASAAQDGPMRLRDRG